ncbi:MAG TPA: hypothetical protein VH083_21105 [Myxococcales bacterium]|nr:hypothetical protein [Myxococcales bacterium]
MPVMVSVGSAVWHTLARPELLLRVAVAVNVAAPGGVNWVVNWRVSFNPALSSCGTLKAAAGSTKSAASVPPSVQVSPFAGWVPVFHT